MRNPLKLVGIADLERRLAEAASEAAGDAEGAFGPGSAIWRVDREAALFLGAGRALLMQLAHPWVATAIEEHSTVLNDPIGRFHRTFGIMFTLVFGSLPQALAAARKLHRRHAGVRGSLPPEALGPRPPAGPAYLANEEAALLWVHATLVDTALLAYELVLPPLGDEARERYYGECRRLGLFFGIPIEAQPADWSGFCRYRDAMLASPELAVGPAARHRRPRAGRGRAAACPALVRRPDGLAAPRRAARGLRTCLERGRTAPGGAVAEDDPTDLSAPAPPPAACGALPGGAGAACRPLAARPLDPLAQPAVDRPPGDGEGWLTPARPERGGSLVRELTAAQQPPEFPKEEEFAEKTKHEHLASDLLVLGRRRDRLAAARAFPASP